MGGVSKGGESCLSTPENGSEGVLMRSWIQG